MAEDDAASAASAFIYTLGRIEPRFPSLGIEKEFAQAIGRAETANLTDREALKEALADPRNRYLARQLCWVLAVRGVDTYILDPSDSGRLDLLLECLRPNPTALDLDLVIGSRGAVAPPDMCNGLLLPLVSVDQVYSFDRDTLLKSVPRPKDGSDAFEKAVAVLFDRIIEMTDNTGSNDRHRALNYLAVRYPAIYAMSADALSRDFSLVAVETNISSLSASRRIVDVVFTLRNRKTDYLEKYFVRVDVTEKFPFLVTKLAPYFDR